MSNQPAHIDEPLLHLVSRGDEQAFRDLFEKYHKLVFRFVLDHVDDEMVAEDLLQDIFTKVWLSRKKLPDIKKFKSFLFVLSKNHALNYIKKKVRENERVHLWELSGKHSENDSFFDEKIAIIEEAITELPRQQKKAWELSRKNGLKYEEIAREMNISRETVKKYIQYSNERIKKMVLLRTDRLLLIILPFL